MAEYSRFFGIAEGDTRQYNQIQFAEVLERFVTNGVFPDQKIEIQASDPEAMSVVVTPGDAWINGYFYRNDSDLTLNIDAADATNPRIDLVILRLDTVADRIIEATVKKGTAATSPSAPALTQDSQIWEIALAEVQVNAGVTSVGSGDITDQSSEAVPRNAAKKSSLVSHEEDTTPHDAATNLVKTDGSNPITGKTTFDNGSDRSPAIKLGSTLLDGEIDNQNGVIRILDSSLLSVRFCIDIETGDIVRISGYDVKIKSGSGSPEGVVAANVGSIYLRNNSSTTCLYVKE